MTENTIGAAAAEHRALHGIAYAPTVAEASALLESRGAAPFDFAKHTGRLRDEWVDPALIATVYSFADPDMLRSYASEEELEDALESTQFPYDPLEYGPDMVEDTVLAHELECLERIVVALEHKPDDPDAVGGFRVWGCGQWLRELLWAATGVVPREPGSPTPTGTLYERAFQELGFESFEARPLDWP
ncbi:hypothetical protein [Demequina gelatinilytica]|uniref:hypothetical protein n=1 Tax=Demequina gelatinilytica TaxID=1638980 RepID=UPI0007865E9F|nr:hypothetical protein [Demequina gelatinilytica]